MAENLRLEDLEISVPFRRKGTGRFHTVGVIGLGVMGQGIAETVASADIQVIAVEKNDTGL